MNNKKRIAIIVKTVGLEYDDRVRKVSIALSHKADVKIFCLLKNNKNENGITSYGVPFKSFKLISRKIFRQESFLLIKLLEFYIRVKISIIKFDIIWANDEESFLFPFFSIKSLTIWDLHEIPIQFKNKYRKCLFHFIEKKCLKIIHANKYRLNYLVQTKLISYPEKHTFINNYPDREFLFSNQIPLYFNSFKLWLNNTNYVYLQGLANSNRYPFNTISSILESTKYKIVVAGNFDKNDHKKLSDKYNNLFYEKVLFIGMIDQLIIPAYLKNAKFSIILYNSDTPNGQFCEANRFYQAIILGVPIICGSNKPMAEIVKNKLLGVSIDSDGRNIYDIINAIRILESNYELFKENCITNGKQYLWNDNVIKEEWWN